MSSYWAGRLQSLLPSGLGGYKGLLPSGLGGCKGLLSSGLGGYKGLLPSGLGGCKGWSPYRVFANRVSHCVFCDILKPYFQHVNI